MERMINLAFSVGKTKVGLWRYKCFSSDQNGAPEWQIEKTRGGSWETCRQVMYVRACRISSSIWFCRASKEEHLSIGKGDSMHADHPRIANNLVAPVAWRVIACTWTQGCKGLRNFDGFDQNNQRVSWIAGSEWTSRSISLLQWI